MMDTYRVMHERVMAGKARMMAMSRVMHERSKGREGTNDGYVQSDA
jgi:hypothetical protein